MWKITAVIMTCSMLLLTGCGGAERQMTSTSLLKKGVATEAIYEFDAAEVQYQYRNSTNLYIAEAGENYTIRQRNLDGTNLVRLRPKKRGRRAIESI